MLQSLRRVLGGHPRTLAQAGVFYRGRVSWRIEAVVGWFSAAWQRRFFRSKAEQSEKPWREKARAHRDVVVPLDVEATRRLCRTVLTSVGSERAAGGGSFVEPVTPSNWRSSGTVVRAELAPFDAGTAVIVTAWPGAQLFDWGGSRRVAKLVADELQVDPDRQW